MERCHLLEPAVCRKLVRLRWDIRGRLAGEGLAAVSVAAAALVVVTFAVDYGAHRLTHEHMTVAQRLVILAGCLAAVGVVVWRQLVRPLSVPMDDEDLALVVERFFPAFEDRLAGSVSLSRHVAATGGAGIAGTSHAMVLRMAAEANAIARSLRFSAALRSDRMLAWAALALGAWTALAGLAHWQPALARVWLRRTVLLAADQWPRQTHLSIEGAPRLSVVRGGPLRLVAKADPQHVVPSQVTFHFEFPSVGTVEETVALEAGTGARYTRTFDCVTEPLRFYVTGGDDRTAECEVVLFEPPQVRQVRFRIDPPPYTRLPSAETPGDQGVLRVPAGSLVSVTAVATKDLSRAAVVLDGAESGRCEVRPGGPEDTDAPAGARRLVAAEFIALPRGTRPSISLALALTDTEGFTNPQAARYTIIVARDREPAVTAAARGVSPQVTDRAMIPLVITASDDYGVTGLALDWEIVGISTQPMRLVVNDLLAGSGGPGQALSKKVEARYVFDLERLSASRPAAGPPGSGPAEPAAESIVKVGETIRLAAVARDGLPQPEGPNWGRAAPLTFRVVSDQELLSGLLQMQKAMREQFHQAIVMQREAQGRTEGAGRQWTGDPGSAEALRLAAESAKVQQQVAARVAIVRDRFDQVLAEMVNNRLGAEADHRRLRERIIQPLGELGGEPMTRAAAALHAIIDERRPDAAKDLAAVAEVQADLARRMESVLAEMVQLESAQELERWLKMIIDMTIRVKDKTEAERRAEEQRLLGLPPKETP